MLVRVRDAGEAMQAKAGGADLIEADLAAATGVRAVYSGQLRLAADCAVPPFDLLRSATALRADELCVQFDRGAHAIDGMMRPQPKRVALVPVGPDAVSRIAKLRSRVDAIMVDAGPSARLLDRAGIEELDAIAGACRGAGLAVGFRGGLEAPDVSRLLVLDPDVLGFDSSVRVGHEPTGPLDSAALAAIRSLIPRCDSDVTTASGASRRVIDRIFVRDFVVPLSIGAYKAERGARQRVRFGVDAEILRDPAPPRDMSDVFSYDVIIETIRMLAARPHVVFVEALAEEVAASLLAHTPVQSVKVSVEKLDVIDGVVGIEIHRRRRA